MLVKPEDGGVRDERLLVLSRFASVEEGGAA
jgi:hypothetical protein